ncbi:uncharacterized protein LOC131533398 [Onychostoma macrolepis]|uniref:Uncharacterized protein n=1 Tax=Onychostoma macrolepis TaxID=369639 RepID=A0A7J6BMA2_9TELE|nr:uncharacterized protein LOC131533398 [Onychostoma macrolepis]KAF4095503.1 hypothetical protein G5714_023106 [Onychostoma macrolepis]
MFGSSDSPWSSEFIQEILLSAERTALLYHLSYLRLGKFPKLERPIRELNRETQRLFRCSEALIMKCVGTSSNLDSSLFPILRKTVEKNKPLLGAMYLEKARTWTDEIISAAGDIVKRYEQHSQSVALCAIDVIQLQKKKEEKETLRLEKMKSAEQLIKENRGLMSTYHLTELQQQLNLSRKQLGVIYSSVHLKKVQLYLSRIQQILLQLQKFWVRVGSVLDTLKDKTVVGDNLTEDLDDMKEEFLTSIEAAAEHWKSFGGCCRTVQGVFSVQSKDVYKFLEINPSSLSEDERKEQFESVMMKLKQISPQYSSTAAEN